MKKNIKQILSTLSISLLILLLSCATLTTHAAPLEGNEQQILKVGVMLDKPPFSYQNTNGKFTGISVSTWETVAKNLKLNYEMIPTDLTYNEAVLATSRGEFDVLVGPVSVTHKRIKIVDFSRPYFLNKVGVAIAKHGNSFLYIVSTVFGEMLIFMIVVLSILLLIFGIILWLVEHRKHDGISSNFFRGIGDAIWITVTSFLRDLIFEPATTKGRVVIIIWLLLSVLFMSVITAVATSSLTVALSAENSYINTIDDLSGKHFVVEAGSTNVGIAKNAGAIPIEKDNLLAGLHLLEEQGATGVIGDYFLLRHQIQTHIFRKIKMSPIIITNDEYAFVFPKSSTLANKIDVALTHIQENGKAASICTTYIDRAHSHSCEF